MKTKRLLALIAALLCLSMLLVSCKKKIVEPEEETTEPTPTQTEEAPEGLAKIFNLSWTGPAPKNSLATKKSDLAIKLPENNITTVENLLIYTDTENSNIQYVYDYVAEKVVLTLTDSETLAENVTIEGMASPINVTTYVNHYIYAPSGKNVVVLTVTYKAYAQSNSHAMHVNYFDEYIHDYRSDDNYDELRSTYEIKVYNTADTTAPVKTINSNTIKSWINSSSFDTMFNNTVRKGLMLNIDSLNGNLIEIAHDVIQTDGKLYRTDADGNMTLIREVGIQPVPQKMKASQNYYYKQYTSISTPTSTVTVYDKSLTPVTSYTFPSYSLGDTWYILKNGDLLVQYMVEQDEDAESYDYIVVDEGRNMKRDLFTFIVSATDGEVTEIDADYMITTLSSTYSVKPDYANYYNAELENIAVVHYIEDQRLDFASAACDLVSMNNEGEILESLKLHEEWVDIPQNLGNGYFIATTVYGTVMVMDSEGKVLSNNIDSLSSIYDPLSATRMKDFIVNNNNGIYNMLGQKVYDLKDKGADTTVLDVERNTVLIKVLDENGLYKVDLFNAGTITTLGKMDATGVNADRADKTLDYFGSTAFGFYTRNTTKDNLGVSTTTYNWYSVDGTLLATTNYGLSKIASYKNVSLYEGTMHTDNGDVTVYHKFS